MALQWNAVGLGGVVSGAAGWVLAAIVLFAAPGRPANRRLALVLFLEGATGWTGGGLVFMTDSAATAYAAQATAHTAFGAMVFAYLAFLATIASPLTRPLRGRVVTAMLLVGAFASVAFIVKRTELFIAGVGPPPDHFPVNGPLAVPVLILPGLVVFVYGLVAAITMWRRSARGTPSRRQGAAYALAFGIRDVAWILFVLDIFVLQLGLISPHVFNAVLLAFQLILSYGILKHQLFDIDLKIKWTIRRGTLTGVFLAAFFVAFAIAEQFLQQYGIIAGGVAVGLLLFVLRPVERAADRLANAAMPHVRDDAEYRTVRKREVYRATVEGALSDGAISGKERDMLVRLQDQLGLSGTEAHEIEKDAVAASKAVA
jgi:hypothetical protein